MENKILKQKLRLLGEEIRMRGKEYKKNHGSYWNLTLSNGVQFCLDDYNHSVRATTLSGVEIYFGMDFGGLSIRATEEQFDSALNAIALMGYRP